MSYRENVRRAIYYVIDMREGGKTSAFADRVGASGQRVNNWKKGNNAPDLETVGEISVIYDLSLDWMIGGDMDKAPSDYCEYAVTKFADCDLDD